MDQTSEQNAQGWLVVLEGPEQDLTIAIAPVPFTIGRADGCALRLDTDKVSRLHATIDLEYQQYHIRDLDSLNGTFVNGSRVSGPHPLRNGDEIRLGISVRLGFVDPHETKQEPHLFGLQGLTIDEVRLEARVNGQLITPPLSPRLFFLLKLLVRNAEHTVTRAELAAAWEPPQEATQSAIDAGISRLRHRLAYYGASAYIVTHYGLGYMYTSTPAKQGTA